MAVDTVIQLLFIIIIITVSSPHKATIPSALPPIFLPRSRSRRMLLCRHLKSLDLRRLSSFGKPVDLMLALVHRVGLVDDFNGLGLGVIVLARDLVALMVGCKLHQDGLVLYLAVLVPVGIPEDDKSINKWPKIF